MKHLIHPLTAAAPFIKRRILMDNYKEVFRSVKYDGKIYDVVVNIRKEDKFTWDGMSIPKMAQRWVGNPYSPKHELAGMVHDWLYFIQLYPKGLCDLIMIMILEADGETRFKRYVMQKAVKWGAGGAWASHTKKIWGRCKCKNDPEATEAEVKADCIIHRTDIFVIKQSDGSIKSRMDS